MWHAFRHLLLAQVNGKTLKGNELETQSPKSFDLCWPRLARKPQDLTPDLERAMTAQSLDAERGSTSLCAKQRKVPEIHIKLPVESTSFDLLSTGFTTNRATQTFGLQSVSASSK